MTDHEVKQVASSAGVSVAELAAAAEHAQANQGAREAARAAAAATLTPTVAAGVSMPAVTLAAGL